MMVGGKFETALCIHCVANHSRCKPGVLPITLMAPACTVVGTRLGVVHESVGRQNNMSVPYGASRKDGRHESPDLSELET